MSETSRDASSQCVDEKPVQLHINDVAFGGKGVGRIGTKAAFVPFTIDGENITAQVVKQKKTWAEARLFSVDEKSPHRVEPPCPYFGRCGGCSYQHIDYAHQLEIKSRQVEQTLRRIGKFERVPMRAIIPSPKQYAYRNRIRVHACDGVIGFYRTDRHELLDIERCPISSREVNEALAQLRRRSVRDGDYTLTSERRGDAEFFVQTNDEVAAEMLALVRRLLITRGERDCGDLRKKNETLVDAFCGAGFFAKGLADLFSRVIGIEENEFAVNHARRNARPDESYIAGDVAAHLGAVLTESNAAETALLLDPPAIGVAPRVLDFILAAKPNEVIYVSCNPATLARDLATLCRAEAYRLDSVTPLDMFPQTAEIEVVAHLFLGI